MSLLRETSYSPKFLELLRCRSLAGEEEIASFLHGGLEVLFDPLQMHGMKEACDRIRLAVHRQEKTVIHGDYDVDGVTGAAILARTLQLLGGDHRVFLPDRSEDGYGISRRAIQEASADGYTLLVTVDCGIAAAAKIREAREAGLDVIVIDHHKIPESGLPPANIILNPLQEHCPYPFKDLSAAGLAFKLSQALLGKQAYGFLDLAAVSTVCDVAPLVQENRILVKNGLKLLSRGVNPGFRALAKVAKLGGKEIQCSHIGFVFGPRINAAGRMSSPGIALRLLLTDSEREAESLALALDEENKLRQKEERLMLREAMRQVERTVNFSRDRIIVVAQQGWHQGVIGIIASRLVDKYHRPAVVIALEGETGKGSGRSIKGVSLYDALAACRDLFIEFGGHAQAAGLSIRAEKVDEFRRSVNAYAQEIPAESFVRRIRTDMDLTLSDLSSPLVRELELLEPHGMGNPRPVFSSRGLEVKTTPVRLNSQTLQFYVTDGYFVYETLWPERNELYGEAAVSSWVKKGMKIDLAYSIKVRNWEGRERVTLEAREIRPA